MSSCEEGVNGGESLTMKFRRKRGSHIWKHKGIGLALNSPEKPRTRLNVTVEKEFWPKCSPVEARTITF
jgi:hypothetical protein